MFLVVNMSILNKKEVVDFLESKIRFAGEEILKIYQSTKPLQTEYKQDGSPVTIADQIANQIIIEAIRQLNSGFDIVSEESKNLSPDKISNIFWLVDPLDGTKEFINKNGQFTLNIALIENNKPSLGIVYSPCLNKLYKAYENKAFCNNEKIHTKPPKDKNKLAIAISKSHGNRDKIKSFLKENNINAEKIVELGSSLKICHIASGELDLYPRLGQTMEWDTAAAHAVLNASGGFLYTEDKKELKYGKKDYLNPPFIAGNVVV